MRILAMLGRKKPRNKLSRFCNIRSLTSDACGKFLILEIGKL